MSRAYFYLRRAKRPSRHARPLARLQRPSYRTRVCATHLVRAAVRRASGARPSNDDSCTLFSLSVNSRPQAAFSPDPPPHPQVRRRRRRFRSRSTRTLWRSHVLGRSSPASTRNYGPSPRECCFYFRHFPPPACILSAVTHTVTSEG